MIWPSYTFIVARKQLNDEDMKEVEEQIAGLQKEIEKNMEKDEEIDDEVEFMIQNMLTVRAYETLSLLSIMF